MQQENNSTIVHFSDRLQQLLIARGMTKAGLADLVGVSPTAIGNYCNGRIPRADELYRIAEVFNVTMEFLMSGSGAPPPRSAGDGDGGNLKQARAEAEKLAKQLGEAEETAKRLRSFLG
jgi:transcriptional regulator with XRE-family HTH domain